MTLLSLLALPVALIFASGGTVAAKVAQRGSPHGAITESSLGHFRPTFVGPAATGCASAGCHLLSGPVSTPSMATLARGHHPSAANGQAGHTGAARTGRPDTPEVMPPPRPPRRGAPLIASPTATPTADANLPAVRCQPLGPGCDRVSTGSGGAKGVKGLNAVDSATQGTNVLGIDIEPPDQGLCAGHGYVVETNNIGEILVYNKALRRRSAVIPLDTLMGLTGKGWSSGGDPSCLYDYNNGGHWFFTEIVSSTPESAQGPFAGCFAAKANSCYEGIAVSDGPDPFGPYHVYFASADYNPAEPGYPYLLNDFAKIAVTRDAFLMFYDEFPLNSNVPGLGGGFFNGAQELAFSKRAMERGLPATLPGGKPDKFLNVAIENMGLLPTPNGTCPSDNRFDRPGITCWYSVIPAQPPDPSQFDNTRGGSGFMLDTLDFYGSGDNQVAVFDWTGLSALHTPGCVACRRRIRFGGELLSGVERYYDVGALAPQKAGPIPLGDECGKAGLSTGTPPPASCPEGGIATNGDNFTEASQAGGQLWGGVSTEVAQTFSSEPSSEVHQGIAYWVIGTRSFDRTGRFTLSSQGYVSAAHEDLEFPAMAGEGLPYQDGGNGDAILSFTLSGNGGPTGADNGGFFPSSGLGRLTSSSNGLRGSVINIADPGQSPQDGFTEYQGFPGPLRPRWGDYGAATFLPFSGGRIYFASEYIQYPNCTGSTFTLTLGTCGGTRDGFANWGTSVNYVVP